MKAVRQRVNIGRKIPDLSVHFPNLLLGDRLLKPEALPQDTEMQTEQRNPLANVVVKLAGDSGLLFLVRFD